MTLYRRDFNSRLDAVKARLSKPETEARRAAEDAAYAAATHVVRPLPLGALTRKGLHSHLSNVIEHLDRQNNVTTNGIEGTQAYPIPVDDGPQREDGGEDDGFVGINHSNFRKLLYVAESSNSQSQFPEKCATAIRDCVSELHLKGRDRGRVDFLQKEKSMWGRWFARRDMEVINDDTDNVLRRNLIIGHEGSVYRIIAVFKPYAKNLLMTEAAPATKQVTVHARLVIFNNFRRSYDAPQSGLDRRDNGVPNAPVSRQLLILKGDKVTDIRGMASHADD